MKNMILKILIAIGIIWVSFEGYFYISDTIFYLQYIKAYPVKYKNTIDALFAQCPPQIDVSYVPKRFEDLDGRGFKYSQYWEDNIFSPKNAKKELPHLKKLQDKFLRSLGDKPELEKSHAAISVGDNGYYNGTRAYYDYRNELLYIEKEVEVSDLECMCNYSTDGKLLRTALISNYGLRIFFNADKKLIYLCTLYKCFSSNFKIC